MINSWNERIDRKTYFQKLRGLKRKIIVIESGTISSLSDYRISVVCNENGYLTILKGFKRECGKIIRKKTKKSFESWYRSISELEHDFNIKGGSVLLITILDSSSIDSVFIKYGQ